LLYENEATILSHVAYQITAFSVAVILIRFGAKLFSSEDFFKCPVFGSMLGVMSTLSTTNACEILLCDDIDTTQQFIRFDEVLRDHGIQKFNVLADRIFNGNTNGHGYLPATTADISAADY
jgi:hypothetical protein